MWPSGRNGGRGRGEGKEGLSAWGVCAGAGFRVGVGMRRVEGIERCMPFVIRVCEC